MTTHDIATIMGFDEASAMVAKKAEKIANKRTLEELESSAAQKFLAAQNLARRMFNKCAEVGIVLEALKLKIGPRGGYMDALGKLGISQSTADRMRKAAVYQEMLPKEPPKSLYGDVWTLDSAMEFGKEKSDFIANMDSDEFEITTEDQINARVQQRLQAKRKQGNDRKLYKAVDALYNRITLALAQGDLDAEEASRLWVFHSSSLTIKHEEEAQ